jgi:hypothetical protein
MHPVVEVLRHPRRVEGRVERVQQAGRVTVPAGERAGVSSQRQAAFAALGVRQLGGEEGRDLCALDEVIRLEHGQRVLQHGDAFGVRRT